MTCVNNQGSVNWANPILLVGQDNEQCNASSHFIFMDANHNDYDAHFVALTLAYSFN